MLHKMLVVDDEIWVRERLRSTIDWEQFGVTVVGAAEDGEEAMQMTVELQPDIVITDIRMPVIEGLEYMQRIRDIGLDTKVVIISGYSDFEYAQRALKLGAFDYILKPLDDDELICVIKRCVTEIENDRGMDTLFEHAIRGGGLGGHINAMRFERAGIECLINSIKLGNGEVALRQLSHMIEIEKLKGELIPMDLKFLYIDIVNAIYQSVLNLKSSAESFSDFSYGFYKQMLYQHTLEATQQWLNNTILKIIEILQEFKGIKKRKTIELALEYIEQHYAEQITLKDVADRLYLNSSYFCKIFREEMGQPFTKYFIHLKVQKAKVLMANPTLKVYEIAAKVGYTDIQYFTKIFKSVEGVTPMQYKERI